jgi:hypothetical protein
MLGCLRRLAPARCFRRWGLFNAGCCRRVWGHLADERLRHAVSAYERYATGSGTLREWAASRAAAESVGVEQGRAGALSGRREWRGQEEKQQALAIHRAVHAARAVAELDARSGAAATESRLVVRWSLVWAERRRGQDGLSVFEVDRRERQGQCDVLRDVMGNPFRTVNVDPESLRWEGGAPVQLARTISQEAAFGELPVLADALEDAGYTADALLSHLRSPGPHVRGCWALDLILGQGVNA